MPAGTLSTIFNIPPYLSFPYLSVVLLECTGVMKSPCQIGDNCLCYTICPGWNLFLTSGGIISSIWRRKQILDRHLILLDDEHYVLLKGL